MLHKLGMKFFIVPLLICNFAHATTDGCKLFPQLSLSDCTELLVIQDNYNSYSKREKEIATLRANEIKFKMLSKEEQVEIKLRELSDINLTKNIPLAISMDTIHASKEYLLLSEQQQKQLIRYSLGTKELAEADVVIDFLDNKNNFITPLVENQKNQ